MRDIISILTQVHQSADEKGHLLQHALPIIDDDELWKKQDEIFSFFRVHVTFHFQSEENLIAFTRSRYSLNADGTDVCNRVLDDHRRILSLLDELHATVPRSDNMRSAKKETFLERFNDTLDSLLVHAEYEDRHLYPLLRAVLREQDLADALTAATVQDNP